MASLPRRTERKTDRPDGIIQADGLRTFRQEERTPSCATRSDGAALWPLEATFDYVARLRGFTRGRGTAAIEPDGYEVAPQSVVARLVR